MSMLPQRRWRLIRTVTLLAIIITLVVFGVFRCTSAGSSGRNIGAGVSASGSHLPSNINAKSATAEGLPYPSFLLPLTTPVEITPGGEVQSGSKRPTEVVLHFRLNRKVDPAHELVVVATSETGHAPWQLLRPTISDGGRSAEVATTHLSSWVVLGGNMSVLPSSPLGKDFVNDLKNTLLGTHDPAQKPKCDRPIPKDDQSGYGVSYPDGQDALLLCMNKEDTGYVLYAVNNRPYPLDVQYTDNLKPSDKGETNTKWGNLIPSPGANHFVLFPREKAVFRPSFTSGDSGRITTSLSGYGQSLYRLDTGLATLFSIVNRFGIGTPDVHSAKYMEYMEKMLQAKDCADALRLGKGPGEIYGTCLPKVAAGDPFGKAGTNIILDVIKTANSLKDYITSEYRSVIDGIKDADKMSILVGRARIGITVKVVVAPDVASFFVDGQKAKPGDVFLEKGSKHTLKATLQYFADDLVVIDPSTYDPAKIVFLLPKPNTPQALDWLTSHPEAQQQREGAAAGHDNQTQKDLSKYPILAQLPHDEIDFRVDYDTSGNDVQFTVTISMPNAVVRGTPEYKQLYDHTKSQAQSYLRSQGVDPNGKNVAYVTNPA